MSDRPTTANQAVFDTDIARFNRLFDENGAVISTVDGPLVDPRRVPECLVGTYQQLCQYGAANGLLLSTCDRLRTDG